MVTGAAGLQSYRRGGGIVSPPLSLVVAARTLRFLAMGVYWALP